ncbi:MAG: hypothetical protein ACJ8J0_02395 [Longimicrobiaceae bacterium]
MPPSCVRLLRFTLSLAALTIASACDGRSQSTHAHEPATPREIDWSRVTARDLDVASVFLVARDRGVRAALDSLSVLARADSQLEPLGHQIAHGLGRYAVARRGYDASVFAECRPTFFSGCYHGVLEGWLAGHPGADAASLRALCASPAMSRLPPYAFRECAHGLGHGLAGMHAHDLFAALPDCDVALRGELARRECYDGVFMENVVHGTGTVAFDVRDDAAADPAHAHDGRGMPKAGDPAFPCDSVDAVHAPSCWAYQPVVFFDAFHGDMGRIERACDAAPAGSAAACWRGIGKQTLGRMPERPDSVVRVCGGAQGGHAADCVAGMVEFYVDQEWKADQALAFCARVPAALRDACYRAVGERVAWIDPAPAAIRAACAGNAACVRAAEAEHAGERRID